jgi:hypothetical protein
VGQWTLLTNHGRALVCIARQPDLRLRDIAAHLGITERRAFDIVAELAADGYLVKTKEGRRTHYEVRFDMPVPEFPDDDPSIGSVLDLLAASEGQLQAAPGT